MSKENEVQCTNNGNLLTSLIEYKIVNDGSRSEFRSITLVLIYLIIRNWEQALMPFELPVVIG